MLGAVRVAVEAVTGADASGSAVFGDGTIIWPIAQVRENAEVGRQCVIRRGAHIDLAGWTARRQANPAFFDSHLQGVTPPPVAELAGYVYHQYTIRIASDRDRFAKALREEHGIGCGVYYPIPNHRLPSYSQALNLPVTETLTQEVLSLPVHPSLSQPDLETIVAAVNLAAKAGS